jgi:hypothetical protein
MPDQEPSSDARVFGVLAFDRYLGLRQAGFSEQQSLILLGYMIGAAANQPPEES